MSTQTFDFEDLFIFEMANNHQGSVEHGLAIISAMAALAKKHGIRAAIKFQFRHLDTFVHPEHRKGSTNKHVPRFLSTALSEGQFAEMAAAARAAGLLVMTTPFDEPSVGMALRLGVDILKVASCAGTDYPLLREMAQAGKPVLASNGGLSELQTGLLVEVFDEAGVPFALQHCVAKYPTKMNELQLSEITRLKRWFPHLTIGFSTHEIPEDGPRIVGMAYAKGARTFEKHVGIPTDKITLNAYSANPEQVDAWLSAWAVAKAAEGGDERIVDEVERVSLLELQRGMYAKRRIEVGETITSADVYAAFPPVNGQWLNGDFISGVAATRIYEVNEPIMRPWFDKPEADLVRAAVVQARMMINAAGATLPQEFKWELSHHYGMRNYDEVGLTVIEVVNFEYCHKILVVFPGQGNPLHFHRIKKETFRVIGGELDTECGGTKQTLRPGDLFTVEPGVWHQFRSVKGCVFEEISTTQLPDDSFYNDDSIAKRPREARKTRVPGKRRS